MDPREHSLPAGIASLAAESIATVESWLRAPAIVVSRAETRLAAHLAEADGSEFLAALVDGVLRPADPHVAGRNLERLTHAMPAKLPWFASIGTKVAGGFAPLAPAPIVPPVKDAILRLVGHHLVRLDGKPFGSQLAEIVAEGGIRPAVFPIAALASGDREGERQVRDARELLVSPGVESIRIGVRSMIGRIRSLDLPTVIDTAIERIGPLLDAAGSGATQKSVILDVVSRVELEPTVTLFLRLRKLFPQLTLGVSLPAALPESLPALKRILNDHQRRQSSARAGIIIRLTTGAVVSLDRTAVESQLLRMLDVALSPKLAAGVRVVADVRNPFLVAFAWRMARSRGLQRNLDHEFVFGVDSALADAAKRDVGGIRLCVPVVQSGQLALATGYLLDRLRDQAAAPRCDTEEGFAAEVERFGGVLATAIDPAPVVEREFDPLGAAPADFAIPAARDWARGVLDKAKESASGEALLAASTVADKAALEALIARSLEAGSRWGERRGSTRATVIDSVAEVLAEWRGHLIETEVSESEVTFEEADGEVRVAIALARVAADNARDVDTIRDAQVVPARLVVVVSPRSAPIQELAGSVLTALAAGSAVIVKVAPESRRSAATFVNALRAAGVPDDLVAILDDEAELAELLLCDDRVDHVVHSGSRHTAKLFHSWLAELPLSSTTGGRNSVIVTPSADLESAVGEIIASALDHAGQANTATSTVILVGSVGDSDRFLGRLEDAVASVPVKVPGTPGAGLSALSRPPRERELASLENLSEGESWRVRPVKRDRAGRLWSPGLRTNVSPNSLFRKRENRTPVIGLVRVGSLAEAIEVQNSTGFGLSAALFSLDDSEVELWLDSADAGLLCVNRAVVSPLRALGPVEGWNRSSVGVARSWASRDAVVALGRWEPVAMRQESTVTLDGVGDGVARLIVAAQPGLDFEEFDWVRTAARSDETAWHSHFSTRVSTSADSHSVIQRYCPIPVTIRLSEGAPVAHLVRVLAAAALAGAAVAVSSAVPLHADLVASFGDVDSPVAVAEVLVESDVRWRSRVLAGEIVTSRIRLIGGDRLVLTRVLHGQPRITVYGGAVTVSGRVELLPFVREQTVVAADRHPVSVDV